jgi:hypothetical protein
MLSRRTFRPAWWLRAGGCAIAVLVAVLVGTARAATAATGADLCAQVGSAAGFHGDALVTAVAVALAESGCNPAAANSSGALGLWQIHAPSHPQFSTSCLYDAQCNANAAWAVSSHGTNWGPWTVYSTGSYQSRIPAAQAAIARLSLPPLTSILPAGRVMAAGEQLTSSGGGYRFVMQDDGNAVLYRDSTPLFATNTSGRPSSSLILQGDGNLVIYDSTGNALWAASAFPGSGAFLALQPDGNLVEYSSSMTAAWATNTITAAPPPAAPPATTSARNDTLTPGQILRGGDPGVVSGSGALSLIMQTDGNLVIYRPGVATWAVVTTPGSGAFLVMQGDGNLVLYDTSKARWSSQTQGNPAARAVMQSDGNLVIYTPTDRALWASNDDVHRLR